MKPSLKMFCLIQLDTLKLFGLFNFSVKLSHFLLFVSLSLSFYFHLVFQAVTTLTEIIQEAA